MIYWGPNTCRAAPPDPFVLPNGLRVVMRERHTSPLVAIDLWVRAGAREEGAGEEGCAHFLEHVLFKGTTSRGVGETDIAIENLGATLNAATGPDAVHFYTTVAGVHLGEALAVLADVMQNATLPDAEVERERGVMLDELAQHDADVSVRLVDLLYARAFDSHPYRRSPGGTPDAIRVRGRDTIAAFYHHNYAPERCTLALTGDLTPERARTEALRAFGDWRPVSVPNRSLTGGAVNGDEPEWMATRSVRITVDTAQSALGVAFRAPAAKEGNRVCAAQLAAVLLGDSEGEGRLRTGMLPGIHAETRYTPRRDAGLFLLTAVPSTPPNALSKPPTRTASADLAALETALLNAVRSLQISPPSAAELNAAKRHILGQAHFDWETDAGLARALGSADITGGDGPEAWEMRVRQLTSADIQRFAQSYLNLDRRVTVQLVPAEPPR